MKYLILSLLFTFTSALADVTITLTPAQLADIKAQTDQVIPPPVVKPPPVIPPPVTPPVNPPTNCGALPPNGVGQSWSSLFQTSFPGPRNRQVVVSIPRNGYRAVAFNTGNVSDSGAIRNFEAAASYGSRLIAISECPGGFNVPTLCKSLVGTYQESIIWSTKGLAGYCNLKKNTTYYWNTKFYNPCTSRYCNTTLRASNSDYR